MMIKIKKIIKNFLTSGMDSQYPIDVTRRVILVNLICSIGLSCFITFGINAFHTEYYLISIIDFSVAVYLVFIMVYMRKTKQYKISSLLTIILIGMVFLFYVYTGGYKDSALHWTYIYPLAVYFVFGTFTGTLIIGIFFISIICIFFLSYSGLIMPKYDTFIISRYLASFISVSITSYCFDYIRIKIQNELIEKNKQLEKTAEKLEKLNKIFSQQAATDKLTDLPNRRKFNEVFLLEWNRAIRNKTEISIIMGDIDYFKKYNDTYGHPEGDYCLKKIADVIKNNMERPGDFASRIGGEEFAIILPHTDKAGAEVVAERLCREVEQLNIPHEKSSRYKKVTISLGVSTCLPVRNSKRQDLIKIADEALYNSKSHGRNRKTFLNNSKKGELSDKN